jgi:phosphonate transport system permease protein
MAASAFVETVEIAFIATFAAIVISIPIALAASRSISPLWLVWLARLFLNAVRTVPSLIWAVLSVAAVGADPRAGVVALTMYSLGYLGKFFADAFESVDLTSARAVRRLGAGRIQVFQYALWPGVRPFVLSHGLWMLEYNIRSASIIGYVGAGGIGSLLATYQEYFQWNRFCAVLIGIFVVVCLLDSLGDWARKQVTQ